ncbi:hypothetical protein F5890DRAFT_139725 [Lentinula detonsa]|uniref:Uncharacterized protein n=1 Tax=Lentinula detonsa TaxID=2804962 RepID=A0AA38UTN9_9AGAR|nr:hypothetical protein F5890DRAFT_139725 [Lentinula detonsa]
MCPERTQGGVRWVIIVHLYLFPIAFGSTEARGVALHIPNLCVEVFHYIVYASEIQPLHNRAAMSSIANSCNQDVNIILVALTLVCLDSTTYRTCVSHTIPQYHFNSFVQLTGYSWYVFSPHQLTAWIHMPENKGRSLTK